MTQLSVIDSSTSARRRSADDRLFRVLYVAGIGPMLGFVALRRAMPESWRRERYHVGHGPSRSLLDEARAETRAALALAFMV